MKSKVFFLVLLFSCSFSIIRSQVIYNAYAKVTGITNSTLLAVSNVNQTNHSFVVNDFVIVMQMQDNVIGTNTTNVAAFGNLGAIQNAGNYEIAKITAVNLSAGTPTSIGVASALTNTYNINTNSAVQLITFRKLSAAAFTTTNNITGLAWDGNIGGVVAFEVGTVLTLAHSISANGLGFIGGAMNTPQFASTSCDANYISTIGNKWAGKGEGIYKNTNTAFAGARGKILTGGGGGNDENSGGGGGGNYTVGGIGGPGYTGGASGCAPTVGGLGGISLSSVISSNRIFMGGGGGSGHANNSVGTVGAAGGGIIFLKTGTLVTTGTCAGVSITANGLAAGNSGNDGAGGGGAAGTIIMQVNSYSVNSTCTLNITSSGGKGGDANTTPTHSGGGGGGQGAIIFSSPQPTVNINATTSPGVGGISCTGCPSSVNATAGGGANNAGIISSTTTPLPIQLLGFTAKELNEIVVLNWATATEKNTDRFTIERSVDAKNWEYVTNVNAAFNSIAKINYEAVDERPYKGIAYYRLKITDKDQSFYYSDVVVIERINKESFSVFPNPSEGKFYLKLKTLASFEPVKIVVFDGMGKLVFEEVIKMQEGNYEYPFNTILKEGFYTIRISNSIETFNTKVIVNK